MTAAPPAQRVGWARLPVAVRIGILYVAARAVTTVFLVMAAALSGPRSRFGAHATIGDLVVGWDAAWYWFAAMNGYPSQLPLTASGQVAENQWAFMPLYGVLARGLGWLVGGWGAGAVIISLVAGYLSALVLYRMMRHRLDGPAAMWAVVFFCAGPLAAMFQVGYAESLFLLWLFLALRLVQVRRYGWLYLLVPLMGATRPGVLAFALFLGLFGIWRWFRRREEPLPRSEIVHILALGAIAVAVGFAWQLIAGWVTGDPNAYLATELAWRRNWIPSSSGEFFPVEGFVTAAAFWFRWWGASATVGYVSLGLLVAAVALILVLEPHVRRLGVEVRLWSASYLLYLLAVFFPQSSIFRLLLPVSPLWGAFAVPRSTWWRAGVLVVCLAGQWWWIYNMYALGNTFWQIP
ncbi:hypothetical protein QE381_000310 [Microbacterium sp. SORGH_AS 888]|nr:hypothetical protein [Microbacterium sp. SORGH_AS_0888]MDQ1128182.1 hypothetical protein [Microbacterium sp. SORGH_AS_0888]